MVLPQMLWKERIFFSPNMVFFGVSNPQQKYGVQFLLISRITQSWGTFLKNVTYISACISTNLSQLPRSICAHIAVGRLRSSQAAALPWARPSASWQKITAILLMEEIPNNDLGYKTCALVPWA